MPNHGRAGRGFDVPEAWCNCFRDFFCNDPIGSSHYMLCMQLILAGGFVSP
jgi:hypothetical protein